MKKEMAIGAFDCKCRPLKTSIPHNPPRLNAWVEYCATIHGPYDIARFLHHFLDLHNSNDVFMVDEPKRASFSSVRRQAIRNSTWIDTRDWHNFSLSLSYRFVNDVIILGRYSASQNDEDNEK